MKKYLIILCSLFLITGCSQVSKQTPVTDFDTFIEEQFKETISNDYVSQHAFMIDPSHYDIDSVDISLGKGPTEDYFEEIKKENEETKIQFEQFDRHDLSAKEKLTYDLFQALLNLDTQFIQDKYQYISSYFSPLTGIHTQLPTLFSDFQFYRQEDIDHLILLIQDTSRYVDEILEYTKKQDELGYFISNETVNEVVAYCQNIVDQNTNSVILSSIYEHIDQFETLDLNKKEDYKSQVTDAFLESFIPAYQDIIDILTTLKSDDDNALGLSYVTNGKDYYELLYKQATGSQYSIQEMKDLLLEDIDDQFNIIFDITMNDPDIYNTFIAQDIQTSYLDYESMLEDLEVWIQEDFPEIKEINYEIQPIDSEVASSGVAAYYQLPALDSTLPNQIRVNTNDGTLDIQSLSTFETIAHEGLPGHMYQVNYVYQHFDDPFIKVVAQFPGYTEGYATYVQSVACEYLDIDPHLLSLYQAFNRLSNDAVAYLDIAIHYDGYIPEQVQSFLEEHGLNPSTGNTLYDQLQASPTAFLSYYIGALEIYQMKEEAQDELGESYSDLGFHTALLKSGQAPFDIVQENIDQYIKETK